MEFQIAPDWLLSPWSSRLLSPCSRGAPGEARQEQEEKWDDIITLSLTDTQDDNLLWCDFPEALPAHLADDAPTTRSFPANLPFHPPDADTTRCPPTSKADNASYHQTASTATSRVLGARRTKDRPRNRSPRIWCWSVKQISATSHLPGLRIRNSTSRKTSVLNRVSAKPAKTNATTKTSDNSPTPASKRNEAMVRAVVTTSTSICQVSNSRTCPRRGSARYPLGQQFWNEFRNGLLDVFEGLPQAALDHLPSTMLNSLTCTASLGELGKTSGGLFLTTLKNFFAWSLKGFFSMDMLADPSPGQASSASPSPPARSAAASPRSCVSGDAYLSPPRTCCISVSSWTLLQGSEFRTRQYETRSTDIFMKILAHLCKCEN